MQNVFRAMERSPRLYAVTCAAALTAPWHVHAASAQDFDTRTRLEDRSRPDFAAPAITVGPFDLRPTVEVGVEAVENLFASDVIDVDDAIASIRPGLTIRDNRPDRRLRLNLSTGYQTFLRNNAEDRFQALGQARARFGLGTPTQIFGGATVRLNDTSGLRLTEGGNVAQPLRTFAYGGNFGISQEIGRLTIEGEGRGLVQTNSGQLIFQGQSIGASLRDNSILEARLRLGYSARQDRRFYVEGNRGRFDDTENELSELDLTPSFFLADRSGDFYSITGGLQVEVTELLSFDANIGYSELSFDDPSRTPLGGLSGEINLYYSPTRLTRFQLQGLRSIDETSNPLFSSFLRTGFSLTGEHELRRDLILRADLEYTEYDAGSTDSIAGQLDSGSDFRVRGSMIYFISPKISLRINAEHFAREGFAAGSQQRVRLFISYAF